jgi:YHS domain-containing protein
MKFTKIVGILIMALSSLSSWALEPAQYLRNVEAYNKQYSVALNGYDPVSFFPEGQALTKQAQLGSADLEINYEGVVYRFATAENKEIFLSKPSKYEPTYGSYCAWGMANDARIEINPVVYTIVGNRIHFFVNNRAKRLFDAQIAESEVKADGFWKAFSGELARK